MQKDTKVLHGTWLLIGIIVGFAVVLVGGVFLLTKGVRQDEQIPYQDVLGVETTPSNYDLGNVPINGGIVTKEYEIKNNTDKTIKIKKIATSCMCTTASVVIADRKTSFFGMEMQGDKNAPVNLEMAPGETGKTIVNFDPAAHGPQGVGPFDRIVWITFSDPGGIKELKFNGIVVNE